MPGFSRREQTRTRAGVMRQALAGMLWSKQLYHLDMQVWLLGHGVDPLDPASHHVRNGSWWHLLNGDAISMPDKWEYPWYTAWDLAFPSIPLALMDAGFAKAQLAPMFHADYLYPKGQCPPTGGGSAASIRRCTPGRACSSMRSRSCARGRGDLASWRGTFGKLLMNFLVAEPRGPFRAQRLEGGFSA